MNEAPGTGTVKYTKGTERLIEVTPAAAEKLAELFREKNLPQGALRLSVIGGGCSGLQYQMEIVEGPKEKEIMVESLGVRVVVHPKSALYVSGAKLDFSTDLQKGGFQVVNPNASSHCSCGQSFSV